MKFSKILKRKAEELQSSGVGEHFLRYKDLKKQLKQIQSAEKDGGGGPSHLTRSTSTDAAHPSFSQKLCSLQADEKEIGHAFQSLEDASTNLETVQEQHIPSQASWQLMTAHWHILAFGGNVPLVNSLCVCLFQGLMSCPQAKSEALTPSELSFIDTLKEVRHSSVIHYAHL